MSEELFSDAESISARRYVQVSPERALDLASGLTYEAPSTMPDLAVGERVLVPLGRGRAISPGVVVCVGEPPPPGIKGIKPVAQRTGVRLPPSLVDLAKWIASYYCCPLGMTLSAMLPAAVKKGVGRVVRTALTPTGAHPLGKLPSATASAWEVIQEIPPESYPLDAKAIARLAGASNVGPVNRLLALGVFREVEVQSVRAAAATSMQNAAPAPEPTQAQQRVIDGIASALAGFNVSVLRGVTGAGKTEVYLRLAEKVLNQGRAVIILVPEISLTPQAVTRYTGRFGAEQVAILHSGLTQAQRNQQWTAIANGQVRLALGARSAIFAPFPDQSDSEPGLGLIVVDEEHDSAYKQEDQPRYHARDVAIRRAQMAGCPVVLGSATPSLESWNNARTGRFKLHELNDRIGGARLPTVQIVDLVEEMRAEPDRRLRETLLGPTLRRSIRQALDAQDQIILLLNRRGFASHIRCADHRCGWVKECDACDAPMVAHRGRDLPSSGVIRCHHCSAEQRVPRQCPICAKGVIQLGVGSQRIEHELPPLFDELVEGETFVRMDSDTMRTARDYQVALSRFEKGELRLLLGTQMLGKGLDFPGVGLVGVISADTGLNIPDFRASERTFQLVSQVAGRAGRTKERPGRVVVQTVFPNQPAIRLAAIHDFVTFADQEIEIRRNAGFPPATRMARIVTRDEDQQKAADSAHRIAAFLRQSRATGSTLRIEDPAPCAISRISDRYRWAVELTAKSARDIQDALTQARNAGLARSDRHTAVDVDPVTLL